MRWWGWVALGCVGWLVAGWGTLMIWHLVIADRLWSRRRNSWET